MQAPSMKWFIDTLSYAKGLEQAGVSRESAEFQAEALAQALDGAAQTILVTKDNLYATERNVLEKIEATEDKLIIEIKSLENKTADSFFHLDLKMDDSFARLDKKVDDTAERLDKKIDDAVIYLDKKIDDSVADLRAEIHSLGKVMQGVMFKTVGILGGLMTLLTGVSAVLHFY